MAYQNDLLNSQGSKLEYGIHSSDLKGRADAVNFQRHAALVNVSSTECCLTVMRTRAGNALSPDRRN